MSAALAPEELELVIPEKETNFLQVFADFEDVEIFQLIHRANQYGLVEDIQETCVKVFDGRQKSLEPMPPAAESD